MRMLFCCLLLLPSLALANPEPLVRLVEDEDVLVLYPDVGEPFWLVVEADEDCSVLFSSQPERSVERWDPNTGLFELDLIGAPISPFFAPKAYSRRGFASVDMPGGSRILVRVTVTDENTLILVTRVHDELDPPLFETR